MNISEFKKQLKDFDALREDDAVNTDSVDRVEPEQAGQWPSRLHPRIPQMLQKIGFSRPYRHQTEAIEKSLSGADVVMESPTASGKTLSFTVPMLDALLRNRAGRGLMIYPMKALAFAQRAQIQRICKPLGIESWPYDGDTDPEHRDALRRNPPNILLTNPEYLNSSFLGWRDQWQRFLRKLQFVVIDEMHEYRGFFGGNMALLLRRFFLYLDRIGAQPRVFLCTATCANPQEHARNLTGRDVEVVSARNVFRPKRHFIFVKPQIPDYQYRDILRLRIEQAALATLSQGLSALVFCPTKRFLEEAFRSCQRKAEEKDMDKNRVSAYHADLNAEDRQDIQRRIQSGDINVVFATNALEMGLDIGGLDGVVLAGFPPSIMSAWQQIGRTGRSWDKDAFVLFYAMNDPIDRFFVGNLKAFLNKPLDELVVDPDNKELINNHLASLINETGGEFRPTDRNILGDAFYATAEEDGGTPVPGDRPQRRINLRGGIGQSFELKRGNEKLGQISALRKFREAYIGAVFTFFGRKYQVHSHEANAVVLTDIEQHLKTEPGFLPRFTMRRPMMGWSMKTSAYSTVP